MDCDVGREDMGGYADVNMQKVSFELLFELGFGVVVDVGVADVRG